MQFIDDNDDIDIPGTIALSALNVARKTGLTEAGVYALTERSEFPQSIWLSPGRRAWLADEVEAWLLEKIANRERPDSNIARRGRKKLEVGKGVVVAFPRLRSSDDNLPAA